MSGAPLEVIEKFYDVDEEEAAAILVLTQWVDAEVAIERHGYPRDNLIPPPMQERLADEEYRKKLVRAAEDQEPSLVDLLQARI